MDTRRGRKAPLGRVSRERGIPPSPLFSRGSNGDDGKARDQEYKTWNRSRLILSAVGLGSKMADSLPVLPEEVYLMIAGEYRRATKEMRDDQGWWTVRQEFKYLPSCPKRKMSIPPEGFLVPRYQSMLKPVSGYFWRMIIKSMYRATNPEMLEWLSRFFRPDDRLRPNEAAEWIIIHCKHCNEIQTCFLRKKDEEREYQQEQRAYRKKMRRVANVWAQRDWLKRLRPRRPKT